MKSNDYNAALSKLFALAEQYPDLKATDSIQDLIKGLINTENRIVEAKKKYNESAQKYNQYRVTFPGNLFGVIFGFEFLDYFGLEKEILKVPEIKLDFDEDAIKSQGNKVTHTSPKGFAGQASDKDTKSQVTGTQSNKSPMLRLKASQGKQDTNKKVNHASPKGFAEQASDKDTRSQVTRTQSHKSQEIIDKKENNKVNNNIKNNKLDKEKNDDVNN